MALIGGITIIIGAALAFVQDDIKKVLAYSTISQLGYMVMALGVGAWIARGLPPLHPRVLQGAALPRRRLGEPLRLAPLLRHEEGHGRPAQVHADHVLDVHDRLARARRHLPARRLLVEGRDPRHRRARAATTIFLVVGLVGAFLTAAYMTRCVYLTFFGEYRGHGHPHESPPRDHGPADRARGVRGRSPASLNAAAVRHREVRRVGRAAGRVPASSCTPSSTTLAARSSRSSIAALGIGIAAFFWFQPRGAGRAQGPHRAQQARRTPGYTFLDEQVLPRRPVRGRHRRRRSRARSPAASYWVNQNVIDGVVNGAGRGAAIVGRFTYDVARPEGRRRRGQRHRPRSPARPAALLRYVQIRRVQRYALLLFAAVGLLSLCLLVVFTEPEGNRSDGLVRRLGTDPGGLHPRRRHGRSCC